MILRNSIFDIIANVICIIMLIGIVIYLLVTWGNIPDQIPGHFAADGSVNRWDSKGTLFLLPAIGWVTFIGMTIIERFPHLWNVGVRVTEENKYRVYRVAKTLLIKVKLIIVALFVFITVFQSLSQNLPSWFMPVVMALIFVPVIISVVRLIRAR